MKKKNPLAELGVTPIDELDMNIPIEDGYTYEIKEQEVLSDFQIRSILFRTPEGRELSSQKANNKITHDEFIKGLDDLREPYKHLLTVPVLVKTPEEKEK